MPTTIIFELFTEPNMNANNRHHFEVGQQAQRGCVRHVGTINGKNGTPLTGFRRLPCASPPWTGMSGHLANPTPDTTCLLCSMQLKPSWITQKSAQRVIARQAHDYERRVSFLCCGHLWSSTCLIVRLSGSSVVCRLFLVTSYSLFVFEEHFMYVLLQNAVGECDGHLLLYFFEIRTWSLPFGNEIGSMRFFLELGAAQHACRLSETEDASCAALHECWTCKYDDMRRCSHC